MECLIRELLIRFVETNLLKHDQKYIVRLNNTNIRNFTKSCYWEVKQKNYTNQPRK